MGRKYDAVMARIKGIESALPHIGERLGEGVSESFRHEVEIDSAKVASVITGVREAIEGELSELSDEEAARVIVVSYGTLDKIARLAKFVAGEQR